ncbi:killer cell lectin-like receptor subfamily B member 1B allele A isoform X3 [Accipiter gentilis]|uniref:killer cell lectin-like receptor subfamily B member 1B allele A isoform X3 n=1 Tax=Astur gentilis TaxID=8957 RepID=UPI00210FBA23|nr:killer cell lectin-like receptor subfamily B member 1B allele A isoform X3 [Accipiter gentilis]
MLQIATHCPLRFPKQRSWENIKVFLLLHRARWNNILLLQPVNYHPTANSPPDSKPSSEEALGCPQDWEQNGEKCYFFSPVQKTIDWNTSRKECIDKNSDLVIIDSQEELNYLFSQTRSYYYLLGLKFSKSEKKWKWINNMEHKPDMFTIGGDFTDYFCTVIGHDKVETASCSGTLTTQNMCEKAANTLERQKES